MLLVETVRPPMVMAVTVQIRGMTRMRETITTRRVQFPLMVSHLPAGLQGRVEN